MQHEKELNEVEMDEFDLNGSFSLWLLWRQEGNYSVKLAMHYLPYFATIWRWFACIIYALRYENLRERMKEL